MENRSYLEAVGECCTYEKECKNCDVQDKCTNDLKEQGIIPTEN